MVIFLHRSIFNVTDTKEATKSQTHSMDVGDNKAKQNVCRKTCVTVATWQTKGWQDRIKTDLGKINCHSGKAEANGYDSIPHPVPNISYCCAKR